MLDITGVACSLLILSFLAILFNTFCLHIIRSRTSFRSKPSTLFLINLLLTHLFQAIVVLPMYVGKSFKPNQLFAKQLFKNGFLFTYLLSFYGVCFGVLLISIDRFLATYLLNRYKVYVTHRNALLGILGTWLYVIVLCLIPFAPQKTKSTSSTTVNSSTNMLTTSTIAPFTKPRVYYYTPQDEWTVFMLFCNAALPFLLILLSYMYVVRRIRTLEVTQHSYNQSEQSPLEPNKKPAQKLPGFKKYKQLTYFTLVLCSVYFILWTPSIIYYTVLSVCEHGCFPSRWDGSRTEKNIVFIIKFLSYCNALVSPALYCLRHPEIKKFIRGFVERSEVQSETENYITKTVVTTGM